MSSMDNGPSEQQRDDSYELTRIPDEPKFLRKMRFKRLLFKFCGEIYVGRRVKLAYFRRLLARLPLHERARILEIGSGDGVFCFDVARRLPRSSVVGLELNPIEARVCQTLAAEEHLLNLSFRAGVLSGQAPDRKYDLIYCLDVLEHITDDVELMQEMYNALDAGGHLLIHVPNRTYQGTDGQMVSVPDEEAWRSNPGHVRQGYAPGAMAAKLAGVGFGDVEVLQTQARPIAHAHRIFARFQGFLPMRIVILPLIDFLIWLDMKKQPEHGNTIWTWAQKPVISC